MSRGTIQNGGGQNDLGNPAGTPKYSTFQLKKHHYTTESFGRLEPCFIFNGIEGDIAKVRPAHELTTYTLKAPLMTPVFKEKDYIMVARQAILPLNWDKINEQPNIGDDVNPNQVGTAVSGTGMSNFTGMFNYWITGMNFILDPEGTRGDVATTKKMLKKVFQFYVLADNVFSYGSLTSKLGAHLAKLMTNSKKQTFDKFGEGMWTLFDKIKTFEITNGTDTLWVELTEENLVLENRPSNVVNVFEFLDIMRESMGEWSISKIAGVDYIDTSDEENYKDYWDEIGTIWNTTFANVNVKAYEYNFDLARLWAYQIAVAEYYTNSKVDYIYSAELFRQLVGNKVAKVTGQQVTSHYFTWNGISYKYDECSAFYFDRVVTNALDADNLIKDEALDYFSMLFSYRRSLKYLDYFTGSKTRPLAVGDVTVNVSSNKVNVVDITRKGQAYRFLNAVNRIGRKAGNYALELMGVKQAHDWHNPLWLASTRTAVNSEVTTNTGEAQMTEELSQTARMYGLEGKYQFDFELDRQAIIIGISFYDLERSYGNGVHRSFFQKDRYDYFNPYLQYTGDQKIEAAEYQADANGTFGYVPAYEEFKNEYNEATGGFMTSLPGYTFIDDQYENSRKGYVDIDHIGPDFIRSKPIELDRFYVSLTGHTLANRFHFILDYYNNNEAKRKMSYNPGVGI